MTKIAILIDGGYFLKRLPSVRKDIDCSDTKSVVLSIRHLVKRHLNRLNNMRVKKEKENFDNPYNLLHRCFYYDAKPYEGKMHKPKSKDAIDFAKSDAAKFRQELFLALRKERNFALRLGEVRPKSSSWVLKPESLKRMFKGEIGFDNLTDDDFSLELQQKGVDMRIGVDIAHMTLKKQIGTIILVAGDADFVPAAKLARREGIQVILDPLWQGISEDLFEHIDELYSGFTKPSSANHQP